jgi:AcrR family transcriptional regulator/DNA-binding transcriptional ArsR family regulator
MSMATPTVENSRVQTLVRRIARLDAQPARLEAVALGLVDALLEGDDETLAAALQALRDARARADGDRESAGWLDAAIAFAHWGLERVPSRVAVARGTQAHDFLSALQGDGSAPTLRADGTPHLGSAALRRLLETDETQVSRTGRRLLESGLVTRRKVGRQVFWRLSPRGQRALEEAPAPQRSRNSEFWQEAIRRGFEAASGDEPGEPREVDPTRERIIESALELHGRQGIQATTWPEIADKAGVPVETVEALFPTPDDLVRSCGQHFMESLQLPPHDRAPEVFAGASSENERIRRLVETFFGVYERGADGITAGRRERRDVPVVDEAQEELDNTLDALVAEALRPLRPDSSSVASLRALTDLEVWRTLRHQGATPETAVDEASGAVERWLEAQPAR